MSDRDGSDNKPKEDWHFGRNWSAPDPFAPGCGCAVAACGLVSVKGVLVGCDQHGVMAERTIRTSHTESQCKGKRP